MIDRARRVKSIAKIVVIVLNFNGKHFLDACLSALRAQTFDDFQTVLVDNASKDGSVEWVRAQYPGVRIIRLSDNLGFCGGNNRGIEATEGEYVALLNSDTEVVPEWLQALVQVLDSTPEVGFCASRMIRMFDRYTIDTAGDVFYTHGVGGKRGEGQSMNFYTALGPVFGACAGAAIYRRSMLMDIGLLDEDFFAYDEDIDLSFRAQLRGYRCQYVPEAIVYHHVGGSFRGTSTASIRRIRRNTLEVLLKNMPSALLLKHGIRILAYYIAADLYNILRGHMFATLGARWENLKRLLRTMNKRSYIQSRRTVSLDQLEDIFTPMSVNKMIHMFQRRLR